MFVGISKYYMYIYKRWHKCEL